MLTKTWLKPEDFSSPQETAHLVYFSVEFSAFFGYTKIWQGYYSWRSVGCPSYAPAGEFLNLLESFNFVLHATGPTHNKGHTLDLLLFYGLNSNNLETIDVCL